MDLKPFRFWKGKTLSLSLILSLSLVGASPLCAQTAGFAYVANSSAGGIGNVSAYTINATTGALTPVPSSPFAAEGAPSSVAVSPNGQFAYVTNNALTSNDVSAYTINATTGALTPVPGSPIAAGALPVSVTTTAPASSCKHNDEERDRDERADGDEHSEGHELGDDGHKAHKKHGCHHSGEKDFEEHDNDKMH
jgi:hypothetical protein